MRSDDDRGFESDHLPMEFDLPVDISETTFPDIYVGLNIGLLAPGDGIITDRHHASADRYEADDPMNQIAGQISPFTLSGWLRHGCERVHHIAGVTACHPGEPNADFKLKDVYDRDLAAGYHEKGSCDPDRRDGESELPMPEGKCVVYDLFGGFGHQAGKLIRRPIGFSPIRRHVDVLKGEAEAHYRQLNTHVRSRNEADEGQPLRHATQDAVGNLDGTWRLTLRELRPEYVGLICEAVCYLKSNNDKYSMQLGGSRNFGAGIVHANVINPLYSDAEVRRVYNRAQGPTQSMEKKDELWREGLRDRFVEALQHRLSDEDGELGESLDFRSASKENSGGDSK